ncbi:MAG: tRNA (guanine-N7-)-methyltransferase [Marivirga sp.]|jgi:tRNA (guanine-N7-)-methyltransferase
MGRQKLFRFEELKFRKNVVQRDTERYEQIKSQWGEQVFDNSHPINLELACGRGEYTIGLAKHIANENFIGVDIKGERLWRGSTEALDEQLTNAAFLRTFALDLSHSFGEREVKDIWIIHPDPRPRERDEKRRLTHPRYLEIFKSIQQAGGSVYFKTDNTDLFNWTLNEVLKKRVDIEDLVFTHDLKKSALLAEHYGIETRYERKFEEKGEKIKYLRFKWKV